MIRKISLIVVGMCVSASAFADVGGATTGAAPKNVGALHEQVFNFLAGGESRENEVKNDKGEMEMVFERKATIVCTKTAKGGNAANISTECVNLQKDSVTGEVAQEIMRLMPGKGKTAKQGADKVTVKIQKVICVAHQIPGANNSVTTSFNCL